MRLGDGASPARGHRTGRHLARLEARQAAVRGGRRRPACRGLGRRRARLAAARPDGAAPWLAITGTNGKTTTVQMLASILQAAGPAHGGRRQHRRRRCSTRSLGDEPYDVLAVELSSYQLHWAPSPARPLRRRAQPRPRPPRLARLHGGVRRRQGPDLRGQPGRLRLQRRRQGHRGPGRARPTSRRAAGPSASPSAPPDRPSSASSTASWSTAPSSRTGSEQRPGTGRGRRRRPARPAQHRQRAGRRRPGPRLRRARRRRSGTGCAPSARTPHRIAHVADVDGVAYVDDSKATNTARRARPPWRPTSRSCGSPADSPRARPSTSWSPSRRSGCAGWC